LRGGDGAAGNHRAVAKILTTGFSAAKAVEKLASKIKASVKNTESRFFNIKSTSPTNL
jgi:hypothetical protein